MQTSKKNSRYLDEVAVTEDILKTLKEDGNLKPALPGKSKQGVTEYPILEFDKRALNLLHEGVVNTLKHSKVKPAGGKGYEIGKRTFDIIASACALGLLAIPIGIIAVVVFIDDPGNPFFSQVRLTKDGKPFKMFKIRTMCKDAEARFKDEQKKNASSGIAFKNANDSRITRVGHFLRRTSLDELPQFLNVLMGDMSIIGPRPPLPREVVLYTPHEMDRLLVKGGLSCICQTEGRSEMDFDEWIKGDIKYIENRNFAFDLKLMFKTFSAVVKRKGAE